MLRRTLSKTSSFHFNVFTIDYGGENIALYGGTLLNQTYFLHQSIKTILPLYGSLEQRPRSVVLVGHSIGGVIARAIVVLNDFDPTTVSMILTLGSPNLSPIINFDASMARFYRGVNEHWVSNARSLSNITVLSVSGGRNDHLVRHSITRLPQQSNNQLSTSLMVIPGVNLTTDHLAIVWCKQLVLVTARFLHSVVDKNTRQVTGNSNQRNSLMHYYFGERYDSLVNALHFAKKDELFSTYLKETVTDLFWSYERRANKTGIYYFFPLTNYLNKNFTIYVAKIRSKFKTWIFVCASIKRFCSKAVDVSTHSFSGATFRVIQLNLTQIKAFGFSHVLIRVPPGVAVPELQVNVVSPADISDVTVPSIFSNLWTFNKGRDYSIGVAQNRDRFFYRVRFNGYLSVFQVFTATVHDEAACFRLDTSWDQGQILEGKSRITLKVKTSPEDDVILNVYTDTPNPTLNLRVQFIDALDATMRYFCSLLPVYVVAHVFLTYSYHLKQLFEYRSCPNMNPAPQVVLKLSEVSLCVTLLHLLHGYHWFAKLWAFLNLPILDSIILENQHREWFTFCPLVLFILTYEIFNLLIACQFFLNFIVISIMRFFPIKIFRFLHECAWARVLLHSFTLSVLLNVSSAYAFFYIYFCSIVNVCYRSLLPPTEVQTRRIHLDVVVSQLWLWLFLFSIPHHVFFASSQRCLNSWSFVFFCSYDLYFFRQLSDHYEPIHQHAMMASFIAIAQSRKKQTLKYQVLACLHLPITVLLVALCMHSLYRAPFFIIVMLLLDLIVV